MYKFSELLQFKMEQEEDLEFNDDSEEDFEEEYEDEMDEEGEDQMPSSRIGIRRTVSGAREERKAISRGDHAPTVEGLVVPGIAVKAEAEIEALYAL